MVIYAEYLFMENFITGVMILALTGKICGLRLDRVRIITGGVLCGLFSFLIVINLRIVPAIIIKIIFSFLIIEISFDCEKLYKNMIVKCVTVFYIVSFVMGGLTISVIGARGIEGIAANGYIYTKSPTYMTVSLGAAFSYIIMNRFIKFLKGKSNSEMLLRNVIVRAGDEKFEMTGYTDTGNHLREPVLGRPVSLISRSAAEAITGFMPVEELEKRFFVVPYKGAGMKDGMMKGFRFDEMIVSGKNGEISLRPGFFAVYDDDFKDRDGIRGFDVLLNRDFIEGGII